MSKILYPLQEKYLSSFCEEHDKLMKSMQDFALVNNVPILNKHAAQFIEQLILIKRPKRVLELGTAIAYTAIRIARLLNNNSLIDTIEKSKDNVKIAGRYISNSGVASKINLLFGEAGDLLTGLNYKYDIIFLDADKEDYSNLFSLSLPLLRKNGIYIIDNLLWQGYAAASRVPKKFKSSTKHIREFNKIFTTTESLQTAIYPIGDGLGIGIKE